MNPASEGFAPFQAVSLTEDRVTVCPAAASAFFKLTVFKLVDASSQIMSTLTAVATSKRDDMVTKKAVAMSMEWRWPRPVPMATTAPTSNPFCNIIERTGGEPAPAQAKNVTCATTIESPILVKNSSKTCALATPWWPMVHQHYVNGARALHRPHRALLTMASAQLMKFFVPLLVLAKLRSAYQ